MRILFLLIFVLFIVKVIRSELLKKVFFILVLCSIFPFTKIYSCIAAIIEKLNISLLELVDIIITFMIFLSLSANKMLIFNVSLLYFVVTMPIFFAISDEVVIFN